MKHVIRHSASLSLAREAAGRAFDSYAQRYPQAQPAIRWLDERRAVVTLSLKGMVLTGNILLADQLVVLELDVPFLLRPFQKQALVIVEREVHSWLERVGSTAMAPPAPH